MAEVEGEDMTGRRPTTKLKSRNVMQFWDLSKPKMARDFLENLRIGPGGAKILRVNLENGTQVDLKTCNDEEIVRFANEIAEAIGVKKK